jgi:hypothetical protein
MDSVGARIVSGSCRPYLSRVGYFKPVACASTISTLTIPPKVVGQSNFRESLFGTMPKPESGCRNVNTMNSCPFCSLWGRWVRRTDGEPEGVNRAGVVSSKDGERQSQLPQNLNNMNQLYWDDLGAALFRGIKENPTWASSSKNNSISVRKNGRRNISILYHLRLIEAGPRVLPAITRTRIF